MAEPETTPTPLLAPAPTRTPVIDRGTFLMTRAWHTWLENSWRRQGGADAPSNDVLASDLAATQDELDATQAELAQTQADLAQTQQDLAGTQAELAQTQDDLTATQADLAAKLPDGTPLSVARYQPDGSGVDATPGLLTTADGRLGIGGSPETGMTLQVSGNTLVHSEAPSNLTVQLRQVGTTRPELQGLAAAGALAGLLPTPANRTLLRVAGRGYDGSAWSGARLTLDLQATEVFSSTAQGTRLLISTTLTGTLTTAERLRIEGNGFIGLCGATPTAPLDVNGDTLRLRTARTPASATAAGNAGEVCWDSAHLYVCVATNTWRRVAHATWV